ncbi:MAG: ATP-binding protein [Paludibacteraceae bacterium]|nr:ATP-binding protein [Paludibacteraceae bacterium]
MEVENYKKRIADIELQEQLEASGAVLIEGAKWCGKTTTGLHQANSAVFLQDEDKAADYQRMASTKPSLLLQGETPRLIDEWQDALVLWNAVRFEVDQRRRMGQFILTGSAVPTDDEHRHTGTGRIAKLRMRPMTLWESGESNGSVSLAELFASAPDIAAQAELTIEQLAFALCRGGWPASIGMKEKAALRVARNYVDEVVELDIHRVDGVEKNPQRVRKLLQSLARNISTMASNETIIQDVTIDDKTLSTATFASYMNALRRIFVVDNVEAWLPSLRSKTAIRTSPKRHFVDPSIAAVLLRTNPEGLLKDFKTFGFLFEDLCARDLRVYAQANDGDVYHYHDKNELECDLVISLRDGRWAGVEVKLGRNEEEDAAKHLLKLASKVDEQKMSKPSFLMILTAGQFAYRRNDGVYVVPIGCLKP